METKRTIDAILGAPTPKTRHTPKVSSLETDILGVQGLNDRYPSVAFVVPSENLLFGPGAHLQILHSDSVYGHGDGKAHQQEVHLRPEKNLAVPSHPVP